jgi:PIN domain
LIIIDTNVLSGLMRAEPETMIIRWLDRQPRESVWTTSITVYEIRFGIELLAAGASGSYWTTPCKGLSSWTWKAACCRSIPLLHMRPPR